MRWLSKTTIRVREPWPTRRRRRPPRERAVAGELPGGELDRAARRPGDVHGAARSMCADVELVLGAAANEARAFPACRCGADTRSPRARREICTPARGEVKWCAGDRARRRGSPPTQRGSFLRGRFARERLSIEARAKSLNGKGSVSCANAWPTSTPRGNPRAESPSRRHLASNGHTAGGHFAVDDAAILDAGTCQVVGDLVGARRPRAGSLLHVARRAASAPVELAVSADRPHPAARPRPPQTPVGPQTGWGAPIDRSCVSVGAGRWLPAVAWRGSGPRRVRRGDACTHRG